MSGTGFFLLSSASSVVQISPSWIAINSTNIFNLPRSSASPASAAIPRGAGAQPMSGAASRSSPGPERSGAPLAFSRNAADALIAVRADIGDCTRCKLHTQGRRQIVFGVGNPDADLMFVGEAPGADEDMQGIPFVGRAGQLLTKIIEAIDLKREDVYIANVIKCRPPGNRNPEQDEVETCEPFLFQQIDVIRPKVIVALGKFAAQALLRTLDPISRLRGPRVRLPRREADPDVPSRRTCCATRPRSGRCGKI